MPLGKYWRSRPFVFSLVPRCHGAWGSAKKTGIPVSTVNFAWADISLPRSHVSDLVTWAGNLDMVFANAFFIVIAP